MRRSHYILFFVFVLLMNCREKYVPTLNEVTTGYLVVEGFIMNGGTTSVAISRTSKISNKDTLIKETRATVQVQGKLNTTPIALVETSSGTYTALTNNLNANDQYRVYIKTSAGKEYASDYSAVRTTPDIDSVSWVESDNNTGLQIYGNTHSAQQNPGYYQFKCDETWEFHSTYQSVLKFFNDSKGQVNHVGFRDSFTYNYDTLLYRCWQSNTPGDILIYTTEKLTQNVVSLFPLVHIDAGSWKLGVLYSINVKMYSISKDNYRFLDQMKKNTESLGSIFDAQPSENNGNVHALANPTERVIGFVEVSQEKLKRIFISIAQLRHWTYQNICDPLVKVANTADQLKFVFTEIPTTVSDYTPDSKIDSAWIAPSTCVDCTLRGTNKKPAFWP